MQLSGRYVHRETGRRVTIVAMDNISADFVYDDDKAGRVYWALLRYWDDFWRPAEDGIGAVVDIACDGCRPKLEAAIRGYLTRPE